MGITQEVSCRGLDRHGVGLSVTLHVLPMTYMSCMKHRIKDHEETNIT